MVTEIWSGEKPKTSGRYKVRWKNARNDPKEYCVTVRKVGRGLLVVPDLPWTVSYPMSEIGKDELEWCKIEQ